MHAIKELNCVFLNSPRKLVTRETANTTAGALFVQNCLQNTEMQYYQAPQCVFCAIIFIMCKIAWGRVTTVNENVLSYNTYNFRYPLEFLLDWKPEGAVWLLRHYIKMPN